jgi:predicted Rossmann fold nucleotide-binding protein DprA/Smf involved in DNA uptake
MVFVRCGETGMKVIITGSRDIINPLQAVAKAINASGWLMQITEVVSGTARGIDRAGERWAEDNQVKLKTFPAVWNDLSGSDGMPVVERVKGTRKYNAVAGHNRNQKMAAYSDALVAIWDGVSSGTKNMIDTATKEGLKVYVYRI